MTEIAFHFNIPDKTAYVCRLLRKVVGKSASAVVVADDAMLRALDDRLWQVSATDFLGHVRTCPQTPADGDAIAQHALSGCARIELATEASRSARHDVLVNLLPQVPAGFEQFAKLVEIVSLDDNDRQGARTRWRHYSSRGYPIQRHDVQVRADR